MNWRTFSALLAASTIALTASADKVKRVGLWSDADPVAPWDFRKAKREGSE